MDFKCALSFGSVRTQRAGEFWFFTAFESGVSLPVASDGIATAAIGTNKSIFIPDMFWKRNKHKNNETGKNQIKIN